MTQAAHKTSLEAAFALVFAHRSMLRAYVHAIVRDPRLVEDVLSEVVVELGRSFPTYDAARPFAPWARGLARRVALSALRRHDRARIEICLSPEALELVGAALDRQGDQGALEDRKARLRECLHRLSPSSRQLVELRYFEELDPPAIAERLHRSLGTLYTAFSRIHAVLLECVRRKEPA